MESMTSHRDELTARPVMPPESASVETVDEWDELLWSLSCTESEDQSSEATPGTPKASTSPGVAQTVESPTEMVVIRRRSSCNRRRVNKAKTLGCYPPPLSRTDNLSPRDGSPLLPPVGLDCFELYLRNRVPVKAADTFYGTGSPANASRRQFPSISPPIRGTENTNYRFGVRRIQSLNRYTRDRDACQLSWESLQTKPPRPPAATNHPAGAGRSEEIDMVVPQGRVSDMINRVESQLIDQLHHNPRENRRIETRYASKSFDQATCRKPNTQQMDSVAPHSNAVAPSSLPNPKCMRRLALQKQRSAPEFLSYRVRFKPRDKTFVINTSPPPDVDRGDGFGVPSRFPLLPALPTPNEKGAGIKCRTARYTKVSTPLDENRASWPPPISSSPPQPPKIMDEVGVRAYARRGKMPSPSRMPTNSTISIYELLQIARLSSFYMPVSAVPRRSSWEADGPIPGLGIRVSVLGIRFSQSRSPLRRGEVDGASLLMTPRSAFSPVSGSPGKAASTSPLTPLVLVVDGVLPSAEHIFKTGQIIVEVNGINLLSSPASSRYSLLLRFMQIVFNSTETGLHFVLASPNPRLLRKINNDFIEAHLP